MVERIETEHLVLRNARKNDLEAIWNNIWSQEDIAKMMVWEVTPTLEEAKDRLERTIKYHSENDAFFVCLKETDEAIGFAGIKNLLPGEYEESGICIAKKYQGKGYAKEVVKALKKLIFDDLKGTKFIYGCFQENDRSRRVCLSQGFKYLCTQDKVREWDQYKYKSDYYYFTKEMYEEEKKMEEEKIELEPLVEEQVDFDTFSKSDFRVVKIKDCIAVPKSKKLLQFTLDDGTGVDRTILSGIHTYYEPEDLIGKKVVAILNLPPRNMMGIDSCGMLMSAVYQQNGEEKLHLMIVSDSIPAGAKLY